MKKKQSVQVEFPDHKTMTFEEWDEENDPVPSIIILMITSRNCLRSLIDPKLKTRRGVEKSSPFPKVVRWRGVWNGRVTETTSEGHRRIRYMVYHRSCPVGSGRKSEALRDILEVLGNIARCCMVSGRNETGRKGFIRGLRFFQTA